ncbi:unnamed protein product [Ilex paraguariensis]|uniref:Wall-associated receptor kinase galacturonan-binding domain-containing protein n=1 Tax=Ilex paraguariensis TaxID=185542 RepID=A0ABC8R5H1_9AQUA
MASVHHFYVLLVHLSTLAFLLSKAPTATQATTTMVNPGCADHCGNLSIPYPFGITKDCYLDEAILITCNHSFNPPIGFLRTSEGLQNSSTTGCMSKCDNLNSIADGSCSGVGCCQTSIPKGVWGIDIELHSYSNYTNLSGSNPCGYAFVAEQSDFKFTPTYLRKLQNTSMLPMVVDWAVGNETCEVAEKKLGYFCMQRQYQVLQTDNGYATSGYRCDCMEGYEGNPYLGCQASQATTGGDYHTVAPLTSEEIIYLLVS